MDIQSKLKQSEFGALVGISQPAVSDLIKRGTLTAGATGTQWLAEYCANLREVAAGRGSDGEHDLVAERARLAHHQANIAELDELRKRRELMPVADAMLAMQTIISRSRARLLAIPSRMAATCVGKDQIEIESEARALIYEALTELARGDPIEASSN